MFEDFLNKNYFPSQNKIRTLRELINRISEYDIMKRLNDIENRIKIIDDGRIEDFHEKLTERGDGYLIVHIHNPEGKEIGSILSSGDRAGLMYLNIGTIAYNQETHNIKTKLKPGTYNIVAQFNGITLNQNVTIESNSTSEVTFTFNRIEQYLDFGDTKELQLIGSFDLDWYHNNQAESISLVDIYSHNNFYNRVSIQAYAGTLSGFRGTISGSYEIQTKYNFSPSNLNLKAKTTLTIGTWVGFAGAEAFSKAEEPLPDVWYNIDEFQTFILNNSFQYWFTQYQKDEQYPLLKLDDIPINYSFDSYFKFPSSSDYSQLQFRPVSPRHSATGFRTVSVEGTDGNEFDFNAIHHISSVPYDILGTAI